MHPPISLRISRNMTAGKRALNSIFIDTHFVLALANVRDQHHERAVELARRYGGSHFVTTSAVILEIGNGVAKNLRHKGIELIEHLLTYDDVEVIHLSEHLLKEAFGFFGKHKDKQWGLVD